MTKVILKKKNKPMGKLARTSALMTDHFNRAVLNFQTSLHIDPYSKKRYLINGHAKKIKKIYTKLHSILRRYVGYQRKVLRLNK